LVVIYNQIFSGGKFLAGSFVGIEGMKLPGVEDKELIQPQEPKVKQRHLGLDEEFSDFGILEDAKKNHRNTPEVRRLPEFCEKMDEIHVIF